VGDERLEGLAVAGLRVAAQETEHAGLARPVDVRVQNPDPGTVPEQGQGQVYRRGGLADAALARGDGDHIPDVGQRGQIALDGVGDDPGHAVAIIRDGINRKVGVQPPHCNGWKHRAVLPHVA
jgi:hypothetical protein